MDSWVAPTTGAPRSLVAKYNFSVVANITYPVRLDVLSAASAADAAVGVSFSHRCGSTAQNPSCAGQGGAWAKFGTSDLLNAASAPEVQRQKLQSELSQVGITLLLLQLLLLVLTLSPPPAGLEHVAPRECHGARAPADAVRLRRHAGGRVRCRRPPAHRPADERSRRSSARLLGLHRPLRRRASVPRASQHSHLQRKVRGLRLLQNGERPVLVLVCLPPLLILPTG